MRNAAVLFRGRPVDGVPSDLRDADGVGRILGASPAAGESSPRPTGGWRDAPGQLSNSTFTTPA